MDMTSMQALKKRSLILWINLILFVGNAHAQYGIDTSKKFTISIEAGVNFAQMYGISNQFFNHFGFGGGVKFNYKFSKRFSFNPEIMYNMKGAARNPTISEVEAGNLYSFSINVDYIELPFGFNYYFTPKQKWSFEFGPYIGIKVREDAYTNNQIVNPTAVNSNFNIYDVGVFAGINYYMKNNFSFNARLSNSVAPIIPNPGANFNPFGLAAINFGVVNSWLHAGVAYTFDFTKSTPKIKEPKQPKVKKERGDVVDED